MNSYKISQENSYPAAQIFFLVTALCRTSWTEMDKNAEPRFQECEGCGYQIVFDEGVYTDLMIESVLDCKESMTIICPICGLETPYEKG